MNSRRLMYVWWRTAYPVEHRALLRYVRMCEDAGKEWKKSIILSYSESPDLLPFPIVRLCKELGRRVYAPSPIFYEGDGVTIATEHGRFPATVLSASSRSAVVCEDETYAVSDGTSQLYIPACGREHTFTYRADGTWRIRGTRKGNKLMLGRSCLAKEY